MKPRKRIHAWENMKPAWDRKHETHDGENMKPACDRKTWNPTVAAKIRAFELWFVHYSMFLSFNIFSSAVTLHAPTMMFCSQSHACAVQERTLGSCRISCLLVSCHTWCVAVKSFRQDRHDYECCVYDSITSVVLTMAQLVVLGRNAFMHGKTWNLPETGKHETHAGENMKPACDRKTWNPAIAAIPSG